jgi:hypothetical protein
VTTQVVCPGCQRLLRIADGVTRPSVTCPRCLAHVTNPQSPAVGQAKTKNKLAEDFAARVASPQARPTAKDRDRGVDHEVSRDVRATNWLLIVLACLGAFALVRLVPSAVEGVRHGERLLAIAVGLGLLTALGVACARWLDPHETPLANARHVVVGTLALVGTGVAGIAAVGVALFVFFAAVCKLGGVRGLQMH